MTTGPLPAPSKYKSGLPQITGTCSGLKTKFPATVMVFGVVSNEDHIMPPHMFQVGLKVNTKVYLDVLKSVVIPLVQSDSRWQTLSVAVGLGAGPQSKKMQAWLQKECYNFVPFSHWPFSSPGLKHAGLLRLVIRREHHQHDLPTTPKPAWSPSIRRAPAGAYEKGMLPVPDPYEGGDWGWRWLHWIDVGSIT